MIICCGIYPDCGNNFIVLFYNQVDTVFIKFVLFCSFKNTLFFDEDVMPDRQCLGDNGIGYEESQKNKTAHITHKSRAIEITNERLKALNKNKTSNTSVKITSRESVGTTVFLKIPLIIKNIEK